MRSEQVHWPSLLPGYLGPESKVLDLGANRGEFARAIVKRFDCHCVAVEPERVNPNETLGSSFSGDLEGVWSASCCDPAVGLGVALSLPVRVVWCVIHEAPCVGMLACSHSAGGS